MLPVLCATTFRITPRSSRSASAFRASEPLILSLSTSTAVVMRRYDWTSLLSLSEVALSRMTAWLALSLTMEREQDVSRLVQNFRENERLGLSAQHCAKSGQNAPFPFDHFFFGFLPPDVAAGAYKELATNIAQIMSTRLPF